MSARATSAPVGRTRDEGRTDDHGGVGPRWLAEIPTRPLVRRALEVRLALSVGDRPSVEAGSPIAPGDVVAERVRDPRVEELDPTAGRAADEVAPPHAGAHRTIPVRSRSRRRTIDRDVELLGSIPGTHRWRVVTGDHRDPVTSPIGGVVVDVASGASIRIRAAGPAIVGAFSAGVPSRGRLELALDASGDLRADGIDVGRAGTILVVGSRIDAEALTRARAMGVRGIVVASLSGKELRDYMASERRQRAALDPLPTFGVLVLDGALRRPIGTPLVSLLERHAGRDVGLVVDPPALVFDDDDVGPPDIPDDWVRVRAGPAAGAEGRVVALVGLRRFRGNVQLEAARVELDDGSIAEVPLADLERFA